MAKTPTHRYTLADLEKLCGKGRQATAEGLRMTHPDPRAPGEYADVPRVRQKPRKAGRPGTDPWPFTKATVKRQTAHVTAERKATAKKASTKKARAKKA